jgi:inner membrane transporter RhtA
MFFVVGAISQYLGAALGVFLFETTNPAAVAWLRCASAAVALIAWRRPWRVPWTRRGLTSAAGFGVVTVCMNVAFFEAIARIPLGTAVAIEFLGPVAVAALSPPALAPVASRRPRDVLAVLLAAAGVALLALASRATGDAGVVQADASVAGIGFALLAAALWAGYIMMGKRIADAGTGLDSLAVGMGAAAVLLAVPLLLGQLLDDAAVFADPRTWLLGLGIGVLSTAVPYALDQVVLTRVGRARFALLLALLPATAAVVGATLLAQAPTLSEAVGIAMVMAALVVSAGDGDTVR